MTLFGIPLVMVYSFTSFVDAVLPKDSPLVSPVLADILFGFPLVTLFIWIDRMVNSVIRLDYLRRDVLSWKKLRYAYWTFVIAGQILYYSRDVYAFAPPEFAFAFTLIPLAYGSLSLAIGTRTARDMTLRSHVKWFGYLGATGVPIILIYGLTSNAILGSLPFTLVSFCFYKMARFLVPVSKLSSSKAEASVSKLGDKLTG